MTIHPDDKSTPRSVPDSRGRGGGGVGGGEAEDRDRDLTDEFILNACHRVWAPFNCRDRGNNSFGENTFTSNLCSSFIKREEEGGKTKPPEGIYSVSTPGDGLIISVSVPRLAPRQLINVAAASPLRC